MVGATAADGNNVGRYLLNYNVYGSSLNFPDVKQTTNQERDEKVNCLTWCSKHFISYCVMRWAGHVARMEEGRGVHKVLVGKTEGKRPLGRPRRRWEDNINLLATDFFFPNFSTPCI